MVDNLSFCGHPYTLPEHTFIYLRNLSSCGCSTNLCSDYKLQSIIYNVYCVVLFCQDTVYVFMLHYSIGYVQLSHSLRNYVLI